MEAKPGAIRIASGAAMRLATLIIPGRGEVPAAVSGDGSRFRELHEARSLAALLAGPLPEPDWEDRPNSLPITGARFAPVVPRPGAIWCVGLNYEDHRIETGRERAAYPTLFTRFWPSLVGHAEPLVRPELSRKLDYEGELAVVIGRGGRHIPEREALAHVAGYACFNDGSVRDFQSHSSQFGPGKNFHRTGGFGPWLVTADEIPDPQALAISTRVDGEVVQRSDTSQMTWSVRALIAYLSGITPLYPGDVLVTGTPSGVGVARKPPRFLEPGQLVEVEISGVGTLRNRVHAEGKPPPA